MGRASVRRWRRLPWLLLSLAGAALAADDTRPLQGEKVSIRIDLLETPTDRATHSAGSMQMDLTKGETWRGVVAPSLSSFPRCGWGVLISMSRSPESELSTNRPVVWATEVEVLEASIDQVVLGTTWERFGLDAGGKAEKQAGHSTARLTLREGEKVLLDYLDRPAFTSPECARNAALELKAGIAEDPALAGSRIGYDLWFVHEDPDGRKSTQHLSPKAGQGEKVAFKFEPRRIEGLSTAGPGRPSLERSVTVDGDVRGRLRRDGSLEISLQAVRSLSVHGGTGSYSEWGRKTVRVQPGEVVRVELPAGQTGGEADSDLSGHSFALILKAQSRT